MLIEEIDGFSAGHFFDTCDTAATLLMLNRVCEIEISGGCGVLRSRPTYGIHGMDIHYIVGYLGSWKYKIFVTSGVFSSRIAYIFVDGHRPLVYPTWAKF